MKTSPAEGLVTKDKIFNKVGFPAPLGPRTVTYSPGPKMGDAPYSEKLNKRTLNSIRFYLQKSSSLLCSSGARDPAASCSSNSRIFLFKTFSSNCKLWSNSSPASAGEFAPCC